MSHARPVAALAVVAALLLPASASAAKRDLYVSLGDSYAVGYQRLSQSGGRATHNGYADQLVPLARKRGLGRVKLVNFGCGGATTTSMIDGSKPCGPPALDQQPYGARSQLAAAERYLRAKRARVAFVTVSIGGNDVTACAKEQDPVACVGGAIANVKKNVRVIAKRLRAAAGKRVPMIGITYPDVILGEWVKGTDSARNLAKLSVVAFQALINPALKEAYAKGGGAGFVDVTKATGAYGSLDELTTLAPYGELPKPVAKVCTLSYYCQYGDIHLRTPGYGVIAKLIVAALAKR